MLKLIIFLKILSTNSKCQCNPYQNIPTQAGMGGGSSDCAYTIKMLNEMFNLKMSIKDMQSFASKLGADCPFS